VKALAIQSLPSSVGDATRLATRLGVPMHGIEVHQFPDGELRVTVGPAAPTTIIYAPLDRPNDKLLAVQFAAEALRHDGARRLVLMSPYLCYMRQDAAFHKGEAISQKVIGQLLARTVDRIITVDAHLHRTTDIQSVFPGIEAENLSATPAIVNALCRTGLDPRSVVVGPDAESKPWVSDLASRLGMAHAVAQKTRRSDRSVEIMFPDPAMIAGRPVLLIDDIVSSGGTLITCAKALATAGATAIDAIIIHALFPDEMIGEFVSAGVRSIRSTHSVPHSTNAIMLDEILMTALCNEIDETGSSEKRL
jgi:ribose-phosphate pyrophosphokinase